MSRRIPRLVWPTLLVLTLLAVLFSSVFPTRTWLDQRSELGDTRSRLAALEAANAELEAQIELLGTDAEIERIARAEFGLVMPGEEAYGVSPPEPAPVTTIAWRLGHVIVGCLGARNAAHFAGPPADYFSWDYPGTAAGALAQLDAGIETWLAGVAALGEGGLARPCGPAEGPFADQPMATLVLHIHRELIHHGAEIALLRDLYAHRRPTHQQED